jgi:DNA-binding LytR/AlgR family response regulator
MSGPRDGEQLRVLVVDDEPPAVDDIAYLLGQDERVGEILTAPTAMDALRILEDEQMDALLLDIAMPGLDGLDLARVLARFKRPPQVVFVTAHEDHAVEAFELGAIDFLLKPVRGDRMREAIGRVIEHHDGAGELADDSKMIPVQLGGVTRFIARSDVTYVEAQGDYARLHTDEGSHLIRVPLATLSERWRAAGFVRVHRRLLVALPHVTELRMEAGHCSVVVGGDVLTVSRRHTRELRDLLMGGRGGGGRS